MSATRAQLEGVMRVAAKAINRGQADLALELLAIFGEGAIPTYFVEPSSDPKLGRKVMTGAERQAAYLKRKAEREVTKVTSQVTKSDASDETSDVTSDASRHRVARVSESEKLSDSGVVSAESESSSSERDSEFSPRVTREVTKVTKPVTADVTSQVTSVTSDGLRVLRLLQEATGGTYFDPHTWRGELQRIALRPEAEIAKVMDNISRDPWVKSNPGRATPKHVLAHWANYLKPPAPAGRPKHAPIPVTSVERHREDAKSTVFDAAG